MSHVLSVRRPQPYARMKGFVRSHQREGVLQRASHLQICLDIARFESLLMTLSLPENPYEPNKRLAKALEEINKVQKQFDMISSPYEKAMKDIARATQMDRLIRDATGVTNFLKLNDQKERALTQIRAAQDRVDKFASFTDPLAGYNRAIAATGDFDRLQASISQSLELDRLARVPGALGHYFDLSSLAFLDPLKELQAAAGRLGSVNSYSDLMRKIDVARPLRILDAQSAFLAATGEAELHNIRRAVASMAALTRGFDVNGWENVDDSEGYQDAGGIITQALTEVQSLPQPTLADLVEHAVAGYMRSNSAPARSWFEKYGFQLLLLLLTVTLTPIATIYITKALTDQPSSPTTEKAVREGALQAGLNATALAEFRFVSGQTLAVRATKRINARAIATLQFSQPVRLLRRDGSWSLVEWTDKENEVSIQGWVLSRYLKKFG
jgi:hypothetical protein